MAGIDAGLFLEEVSNPDSERSRFKITHSFSPVVDSVGQLLVVHVNIPGRYCANQTIFSKLSRVLALIKEQCGLTLGGNPSVAIESTFLLEHQDDGRVRVFTGTVQTAYQTYNQLADFQRVSSLEDLEELLYQTLQSDNLRSRLDRPSLLPSTKWDFLGVVSIVLNFQCKVKSKGYYRPYLKTFPSL